MANGAVVKFGWLVAGLVVGAAVAVGVMELVAHITENGPSDVTNSTTNSTGTRVRDSLQFLLVVSTFSALNPYYALNSILLFF